MPPSTTVHAWDLPGSTCERDGFQPIRLIVHATLTDGADPILLAVTLETAGTGITCGAKWSPTWAEQAIAKLGWLGLPISQIVSGRMPADTFDCACTEVSLGPKLWRLLASLPNDAC